MDLLAASIRKEKELKNEKSLIEFKDYGVGEGGAFGGNRGLRPVPPEKGVFPLDHFHECDLEKKEYIACLKTSSYTSERCRHFSKKYLECRMERNLMAKQDMSELGFGKEYGIEAPHGKNEEIDEKPAA